MINHYNHIRANGIPTRPSIPVLNNNSTPTGAIQNILSQPDVRGLVVGELHNEPAAFQLLIDQMDNFAKNGVTTIYLEGAPFFQGSPRVSDAALLPSDAPSLGLHPYDAAYTGGPTMLDIISEADKRGIKVVGLEHQELTWHMDNGAGNLRNMRSDQWEQNRLQELNYYGAEIIKRTPPGEKFVALVGKAHMNTFNNVPGVAELTGGVGISVTPAPKGSPSVVRQPPHMLPPLKLMHGDVPEPIGDVHIEYNIDALTV
ncbi:membrane-targeted effector domain-containing toxin [Pseudomonas orientalis]|uniref:membrane-targeted effector domain-containing toxin n=3 Tax=Pseudomonas TaxID=286 RepID=UPI00398799B6